ncbi:hypothetical protein [Marinobacter sp.]|uniref:hypothetical protein n=1 Tax=Marinobacter sp. TaxID=50741 RepID=UPI00356965E5
MIRRFPTCFLLIALALLSLSARALEPGDDAEVFTSDGGVSVTLLPMADGNQALVRLNGVDHALDGVVMLARIEQRPNDERAYRAEIDGKMRSLVVFARSYWAPTDYTAYIPGREEPYALMADEEGSARVDKVALMAEYEQQTEQGVQAALARFDRDKALERHKDALRAVDASASKVCGTEVTTRVNWKGLDNEQLNSLSISGYCGQVAAEMEHLCRKEADFKQKVAEVSGIDCGFGDTLDLRREAGKLVFRTREDARNQREAITGFLRNL